MVEGVTTHGELNSKVLSFSQALYETFPLRTHVPFFNISYYTISIMLVSASSYYFTLTVPMREVSFVGMGSPFSIVYAKWFLVFRFFATSLQRLNTALGLLYNYTRYITCWFIKMKQFAFCLMADRDTRNGSYMFQIFCGICNVSYNYNHQS